MPLVSVHLGNEGLPRNLHLMPSQTPLVLFFFLGASQSLARIEDHGPAEDGFLRDVAWSLSIPSFLFSLLYSSRCWLTANCTLVGLGS